MVFFLAKPLTEMSKGHRTLSSLGSCLTKHRYEIEKKCLDVPTIIHQFTIERVKGRHIVWSLVDSCLIYNFLFLFQDTMEDIYPCKLSWFEHYDSYVLIDG